MTRPTPPPSESAAEPSLGELVGRMSEQMSRLVRDEMRLAQAELAEKGKRAGLGVGMFGGAGVFSLYGLGALVAAAILALAGPLSGWLAALIVAAALFVIAGVGVLVGKREVQQATPPLPEAAVQGIKEDVHTLKPGSRA